MDCVFFNDSTSQLNWGCHATTFFTKLKLKQLNYNIVINITLKDSRNQKYLENVITNIKNKNIKYIFINGEGSLYEQSDIKGNSMMYFINKMLEIKNIKIFLINSAFDLTSKNNISYFNNLLKPNLKIYLREPISIINFNNFYKNHDVTFQPDFLYLIYNEINKFDNQLLLKKYNLTSKKYIVIGGNSNYYRDDRPQYDAIIVYVNMINKIKATTKYEIVLYAASGEEIKWLSTIASKTNIKLISVSIVNWQDAFVILSNAYLSISGRYHPSIMSIIGKVPSLLISANHCKMNGINEMFFKDQEVINSHNIHNNYEYIIDFIKKYENSELYNNIVNHIEDKLNYYLNIINNIKFV
jgi:polysaccharide pyruvyl transferase WcaK-like protein